jgi:hypothetical protein
MGFLLNSIRRKENNALNDKPLTRERDRYFLHMLPFTTTSSLHIFAFANCSGGFFLTTSFVIATLSVGIFFVLKRTYYHQHAALLAYSSRLLVSIPIGNSRIIGSRQGGTHEE